MFSIMIVLTVCLMMLLLFSVHAACFGVAVSSFACKFASSNSCHAIHANRTTKAPEVLPL